MRHIFRTVPFSLLKSICKVHVSEPLVRMCTAICSHNLNQVSCLAYCLMFSVLLNVHNGTLFFVRVTSLIITVMRCLFFILGFIYGPVLNP